MKRMTAVVALGSAGVIGLGLAMPVLADATGSAPASSTSSTGSTGSTGSSSSAPLTSTQKDAILDFLADHPQLAQGLAARAQGWAKLLAANPAIKTELDKVLALPVDQRRAELKKWLAANPDAKRALQTYRLGLQQDRLTKRQDRLDRRQQRLQS